MAANQMPSRRRQRHWNQRQCKKFHVGAFQELGFSVDISLRPDAKQKHPEEFWDALIETIEGLQLAYGGGETGGFITAFGRGSVTNEQRKALLCWVANHPYVETVRASELIDGWYGENGEVPPFAKPIQSSDL